MQELKRKIQVKTYFHQLYEQDLEAFTGAGLNPEICFSAGILERFGPAAYQKTAQDLAEAGLTATFHAPFVDLSAGSSDPGVRALTRRRLAQTLEAARVIRPKTVVCHAGFEDRRHDYYRDKWLEASLKTWSWFARELAGLGSRLMLENVWERTPDELLALARGLSGLGAGICFDVGHHAVFGRGPARDWITALGPHINQLHLHDNFGIEDQHLALGRGNIDWKPLFEQLSRLAEPLAVTLEVQVGPDLDQSLDRLRALWPW